METQWTSCISGRSLKKHRDSVKVFSFISFTTVGFGDRIPLVESTGEMLLTILYLTWGILLTTELFSILNKYFRKVSEIYYANDSILIGQQKEKYYQLPT